MRDDVIPLLSKKPFDEFTPKDYKEHIRSLFHKREPRKATAKPKKPFLWRVNAKGTLIIKVNREPKWLSREEIDLITKESGKPANEVWLKVTTPKKGQVPIKISTQAEEDEINQAVADIPW